MVLTPVLVMAACSRPVEVTPPPAADDPACSRVASRWPTTVADLGRVDTTSSSPAVAAWGDPAVVARCGVTALGPTTQDCIAVDGIDWVVDRLSDGASFTTYGTDPAIEVLVPADYAPEPLLLPAFDEAAAQLPSNGRSCT